jgi:ribosomal-protein-alanine N-acetyltransferase
MSYCIRMMREDDIPQAIAIDRESFPTQWPHPTYISFKHELHNRLARYVVVSKQGQNNSEPTNHDEGRGFWNKLNLKNIFPSISRTPDSHIVKPREFIIGYTGFWMMVDEAHITTIAIREAYRRRGLGELLIISVVDMALDLKAKIITLEVRVSNKNAQVLYEKYGFNIKGTRSHYYSDNGEDAYIMSTDLISSDSFQSRFHRLIDLHREKWGQTLSNVSF